MKNLRSYLIRYGTGALSPAVALILALLLWPVIKPFAMPLFLSAIVISAWQGGKGPGLVATLVSGVIIDYVFIPPQYRISAGWDDLGRLAVFGLEGFLLSWLVVSRKRIEHEVRKSREDLRALSAHLQSGIEAERTRIAREIHDELGQSLTGLKFDVSWLREQATESTGESERMKLDATLKNIDTAIQSVRRIATELRPPVLDTLGLTAAIEWQAAEFRERTGIPCEIKVAATDTLWERDFSTACFRIFQEILTNITRHAKATRVDVELAQQDDALILTVRDDGRGISEAEIANPDSIGLSGMRERAAHVGGEIYFFGLPRRGTTVTVRLPLPAVVPVEGVA